MTDADNRLATEQAFADPQVGDRFHEMYSYWIYIVARVGKWVCIMEAHPPCTLPNDGKVSWSTVSEFQNRFAYKSIPGYCVRLSDRGNNVHGWLEEGDKGD